MLYQDTSGTIAARRGLSRPPVFEFSFICNSTIRDRGARSGERKLRRVVLLIVSFFAAVCRF